MKDKYDLMKWTISKKIWWTIMSVLGIFGGCFYTGALIVPNWEGFIEMPWLHQLVAYVTLFFVGFLALFILYIVVHLVFSNQRLEDKNKDLKRENADLAQKIREFEKELRRIRKDE